MHRLWWQGAEKTHNMSKTSQDPADPELQHPRHIINEDSEATRIHSQEDLSEPVEPGMTNSDKDSKKFL